MNCRVSEGSGIRLSYHQCVGESSEYSMCNPQACSPLVSNSHPEDFRQFQCSLYNNRTIRGHHVPSWTPFNMGTSWPLDIIVTESLISVFFLKQVRTSAN